MPRLPDLSALGQRPTPQSSRQISVADVSAPDRALADLGAQGMQYATVELEKQAKEEDAKIVFDARRQLDDWERANVYDPQAGAVSKLGKDAFDLPKTLPGQFDSFAETVGKSITTQRARDAFQQITQSRREQIGGWADRHALQQKNVYDEGQFQADISSSINRAALMADAGDLNTSKAEVAIASQRAIGYLRQKGRSEEEIAKAVADINSKSTLATVNILLEKDKPLEADAYLKANAKGMNIDDLLRSQSAVGKAVDAQVGLKTAMEVVQANVAPALAPTNSSRLTNLVMNAESGGKRYGADGNLLTSPKGAKGEMQVMDATNKSPGYGVAPAKDNSPDERARVGRDYLDAMVREYGGDVPKALAAYNAGPGAVDKAVKKAAETGDRFRAVGNDDWLVYMPKETQAYVAKISGQYAEGNGAPAMPSLQALHQDVRNRIGVSSPQRYKTAIDEVNRQYADMVAAKKQTDDDSTAKAMQWLAQNGGRFSQLPASLRSAVPPKEIDSLMNYGTRVAKGDDITNPVMFQKMATDDAWVKGMTDQEFFIKTRQLSEADAEKMAMRRGSLMNKNAAAGMKPTDMDTAGVNALLNNRLQQIGVDPTPKDGDKEAMRVGAIRKHVWDTVLNAQQAAGKKFNDAEIAQVLDDLFAKSTTFQTTFLGIPTGTSSQRLMAMKASDIPSAIRDRLKADFKTHGIDATDADILGAYLRVKK